MPEWEFFKQRVTEITESLKSIDTKVDNQQGLITEIITELGLRNGNGLKKKVDNNSLKIQYIENERVELLKNKVDYYKKKPTVAASLKSWIPVIICVIMFLLGIYKDIENGGMEKAINQQASGISTPEPTP